ncbi:MAG: hypothetical protein ACFFD1_10560, partial [Candidatus Thorarchaeota archaeon]
RRLHLVQQDVQAVLGHWTDQGIPEEHVMFESNLQEEKETSNDMSDVVAFGNSELSQGREGNLRYNIILFFRNLSL